MRKGSGPIKLRRPLVTRSAKPYKPIISIVRKFASKIGQPIVKKEIIMPLEKILHPLLNVLSISNLGHCNVIFEYFFRPRYKIRRTLLNKYGAKLIISKLSSCNGKINSIKNEIIKGLNGFNINIKKQLTNILVTNSSSSTNASSSKSKNLESLGEAIKEYRKNLKIFNNATKKNRKSANINRKEKFGLVEFLTTSEEIKGEIKSMINDGII